VGFDVKVTFTRPFADVATGVEALNAAVAPFLDPKAPCGSGLGTGAVLA
jgi:hypothetical protein